MQNVHKAFRLKTMLVLILAFMVLPPAASGFGPGDDSGGLRGAYAALIAPGMQRGSSGHLRPTYIAHLPENLVFFKIEQGFSFGRILDQRMSNLHYTGPGAVLGFSRHVQARQYISEIGFARAGFHFTEPAHEGTTVYNPIFGVSYMHVRRMNTDTHVDIYLGGKALVTANARIAPSLGNSFLYADFIAELQPKASIEQDLYFFERVWQFDYSLAFSLLGYGIRLPEYGASYQISGDGGSALMHSEAGLLHPGNHAHLVAGIFLREPLGGTHNPNWLRLGYVWDYYRVKGKHDLTIYNTNHQLVLELYFMIN